MNRKDAIKWLEALKSDIGRPMYSDLWHYEQALDEIIGLLYTVEVVDYDGLVNKHD